MTTVSSLTNSRVKAAVRLRDRRERDATGLTIVDGAREILRALESGIPIETAFVAPDLIRTADARAVEHLLASSPSTIEVSAAVLAKVAFGDRSDGIVAIIRPPLPTLDELVLPDDPLLVVMEGIEKPGNVGAVLRSADGAGAVAVISADALTDAWNPNAIRASIGTIFSMPVISASSEATRAWLLRHEIRIVAAVVESTTAYFDADLTGALALVLGSEAVGLGETWRRPPVEGVTIPMAGVADSLNVSVAAAVLLYESNRQRSVTTQPGD